MDKKKMSKIEKPKKVLKKTLKVECCDDNALIFIFWMKKSVTINFLYFSKKLFRSFFCFKYMVTLGDKNKQKQAFNFYCEICDYGTCRKSNFDSHLSTDKHKMVTKGDKKGHKQALISSEMLENKQDNADEETREFVCACGKEYKHRQGLWRHKKKCPEKPMSITSIQDQTELVQYLMKENSEFKQLMIEQNKQMIELAKNTAGHHNTNHVNSHNKTFNLQVFLNETCKNAINISDFINQLQVSISDLEETGKLGFTEGISKIFINGLKDIDIPDRPLHCSDLKRETIYIKNNNEWTKDTEENLLLVNAIKQVSNKNMKQITEWQKVNPEYRDSSSKINDRYLKIVSESMSGSTKEECEKNYKKIIKNIAKETVIDKNIS